MPWFLRVCSTSLLKTLGKGEIARYEIAAFPTDLKSFLSFSSSLPTISNWTSLKFVVCKGLRMIGEYRMRVVRFLP